MTLLSQGTLQGLLHAPGVSVQLLHTQSTPEALEEEIFKWLPSPPTQVVLIILSYHPADSF